MDGLNKEIVKLAGPAIVSNITVPLLGLCDTAIAGHLGNVASIGAISVGAMMLNVVVWLLTFLRMGTSGLSAMAYGSGDWRSSADVLKKSFILAAGASVLILLMQIPLLKLLLWYASPGEEVAGLATLYYHICIWGVPGQLMVMAVTGWYIGSQNTRIPMALAIGTNVVNIGISFWLALGLSWGLRGIATGTLAANWIGAIAGLVLAFNSLAKLKSRAVAKVLREGNQANQLQTDKDSIKGKSKNQKNENERGRFGWGMFFRMNGELFLRSACVMLVSISMTAFGARMGEVTLAVNAVMMQFFIFFSYFMDGFAFAGEALVGRYNGEGDRRSLHASVGALLRWGGAMAAGFFFIYLVGSSGIAGMITSETTVLTGVADMKIWVVLLPPITVMAFLFDGIYIGLCKTRIMLYSTLGGAVFFFCISCYAGHSTHNNYLLWTAFEVYLLMRGLILGVDYVGKERKKY